MKKNPNDQEDNKAEFFTMPNEICDHCKESIWIRNPSGFCDHLYYPEYCEICKKNSRIEATPFGLIERGTHDQNKP